MAIARDTSLYLGGGVGTTLTTAYTVTGSNTILVVFFYHEDNVNGSSVTWNTTESFTRVATTTNGIASHKVDAWVLVNPTTGTHNIVCTPTGTVFRDAWAVSYTGALQSGQPDAFDAPAGSTSSSSKSSNITVVASNCWICAWGGDDNGTPSAVGSGTMTKIAVDQTAGTILMDSNGTVSTGSQAYGFTGGAANGDCGLIGVSISPAVAAATTSTFSPKKSLLGVGK